MPNKKLKKIVIDPITRIEGHLRIEVEIDGNNTIQEAWASGQLFRGIETILKGRDPRDTPLIAQRICGVCTNSHYRASMEASENAYNINIPQNAQIIRDLISLSLFIQDHIIHYYHLHSLDFVDVTSALKADISKTIEVANALSPNPYKNSYAHLEYVQNKLQNFIDAGRLGLFSNGYWGHSSYKLSPEENLIHMSHYLDALEIQRELSKAIAIFGGKTPHPQYMVMGGITSVADMLNPQRINDFIFIIKNTHDFINRAYLADTKMITKAYYEDIKNGQGKSNGNYMAVGGYSFERGKQLFESGVIYNFDFSSCEEFELNNITEESTRAWYEDEKTFPNMGTTTPFYTDLNTDGSLKTEHKYSWIKSPRYKDKAMEVGPLSRLLVGYVKNSPIIKPYVDEYLIENNLKLIDLTTTIGRNIARSLEAKIVSEFMFDFVNNLLENIKYYDHSSWRKYDFEELSNSAQGQGVLEVPRGVLCHFITIEEQKIKNYQAVVPTTWNASPKCKNNIRGAYEEALIGIRLENPKEPLEVLRVIHSFDPCIACAVHIIDSKNKELTNFKVSH